MAIDQMSSGKCVVSIFLAYSSRSEPSMRKHINSSRRSYASQANRFPEVLPKAGLVYSEKGNLSEVLCKPKLLPLKVRTIPSTSRVICAGCTCLLWNAKKALRPSTRTAGNDHRRVDESFLWVHVLRNPSKLGATPQFIENVVFPNSWKTCAPPWLLLFFFKFDDLGL